MSTPETPDPRAATTTTERPGGIPLSYREMEESTELSAIEHEGQEELLTLNMGPHHPATHGVLRLLCTLEGEVVRDMKPMIGYVHTGIEKTAEDKAYWKAIPVVERMDYLAYYFNAHGVLRRGGDDPRARGPAARAVPARDPPRAQPDHVPPGVARHQRARPRRDVDVLVLLPRPRADPRPVRDVLRPAHAHALHPGRRRDGGHPGRLRGQGQAVHGHDAHARRPVRRRCCRRTRSRCSACAASRPSTRRRCSGSASPARCCARPATRGTCARPRRTRPTTTSTSRSPSARSATTGTASWSACRR